MESLKWTLILSLNLFLLFGECSCLNDIEIEMTTKVDLTLLPYQHLFKNYFSHFTTLNGIYTSVYYKIRTSGIFASDFVVLRELTYINIDCLMIDGKSCSGYWGGMKLDKFKEVLKTCNCQEKLNKIVKYFDIDLTAIVEKDLNNPLHQALAALLVAETVWNNLIKSNANFTLKEYHEAVFSKYFNASNSDLLPELGIRYPVCKSYVPLDVVIVAEINSESSLLLVTNFISELPEMFTYHRSVRLGLVIVGEMPLTFPQEIAVQLKNSESWELYQDCDHLTTTERNLSTRNFWYKPNSPKVHGTAAGLDKAFEMLNKNPRPGFRPDESRKSIILVRDIAFNLTDDINAAVNVANKALHHNIKLQEAVILPNSTRLNLDFVKDFHRAVTNDSNLIIVDSGNERASKAVKANLLVNIAMISEEFKINPVHIKGKISTLDQVFYKFYFPDFSKCQLKSPGIAVRARITSSHFRNKSDNLIALYYSWKFPIPNAAVNDGEIKTNQENSTVIWWNYFEESESTSAFIKETPGFVYMSVEQLDTFDDDNLDEGSGIGKIDDNSTNFELFVEITQLTDNEGDDESKFIQIVCEDDYENDWWMYAVICTFGTIIILVLIIFGSFVAVFLYKKRQQPWLNSRITFQQLLE